MSRILLITPLVPANRSVMEYCDALDRAFSALLSTPRRVDLDLAAREANPWWRDGLEALCSIHDAIAIVAPSGPIDGDFAAAFRQILARIPPRTIVWITDGTPQSPTNAIFEFALRQDLNVFSPVTCELLLPVQVLEFLNYVYHTNAAPNGRRPSASAS